jgi:DMSO/TMAO reductase YedYZ molybdopterin-dependent catalytic subunit
MRRREFIAIAGGASMSWRRLFGDNSVLSKEPLISQFNLESLEGAYTPVDEFYVRNHNPVPADLSGFVLHVDGEVGKPQALAAADLARLPTRRLAAVLECAGNGVGPYELASNAQWEGWRLEEVLQLAVPRRSAAYLYLKGRDGFIRSVPAERAAHDALLVTHINGEPLPATHGGPWRIIFPGYYGMDSVKWVEQITVSTTPLDTTADSYLMLHQAPDGSVKRSDLPGIQLKSAFVYPAVGALLQLGRLDARGVVWSNGAKILGVEVSTDGGATWRIAKVEPAGSPYEWRLWHATVELSQRGLVELACKAIDAGGHEQPTERPAGRRDDYADNRIERVRVLVM